jgi:phage tail-like protein
MPIARDNPYGAFNFQVTVDFIGNGDPNSIAAGFQEISGLSLEVAVAEYRNGNEVQNHVRKIPGLTSVGETTLKRGLIGVKDLYDWIRATGDGAQNVFSTVTIELLDEAHENVVMTWKLSNAWPSKYTGATLNAKTASDVAIEELVLISENMVVE